MIPIREQLAREVSSALANAKSTERCVTFALDVLENTFLGLLDEHIEAFTAWEDYDLDHSIGSEDSDDFEVPWSWRKVYHQSHRLNVVFYIPLEKKERVRNLLLRYEWRKTHTATGYHKRAHALETWTLKTDDPAGNQISVTFYSDVKEGDVLPTGCVVEFVQRKPRPDVRVSCPLKEKTA